MSSCTTRRESETLQGALARGGGVDGLNPAGLPRQEPLDWHDVSASPQDQQPTRLQGASPRALALKASPLRAYYYLAPLWMLLEFFLWPGIRAEMIVGPSLLGVLLFYSLEAGIGVAYWKKLPGAEWAALAENLVYVTFSARFVLIAPFDIGLGLGGSTADLEDAFLAWSEALPGVLLSLLYLSIQSIYLLQKLNFWLRKWDLNR